MENQEIVKKLKELGMKHYIKGYMTINGNYCYHDFCCQTDEEFTSEVDRLFATDWVEYIDAIHIHN